MKRFVRLVPLAVACAYATASAANAQTAIFDVYGALPGDRYGAGACAVGDFNGDFVPDFCVASSAGGAPTVEARSGFDGLTLWSATLPYGTGGRIVSLGDVNGDGKADVAAAARPTPSSEFAAYVLSGANGSVLWTYAGATVVSHAPVEAGRDVDGDGVGDLLLRSAGVAANVRETHAISGVGGAVLRTIVHGDYLTLASEALFGDVDGDGKAEIATGLTTGAGVVNVYVASSTTPYRTHTGAPNDRLGATLLGLADVDGDGVDDYALGAQPTAPFVFPPVFPLPTPAPPYLNVYSGATGALLYAVSSTVVPAAGGVMNLLDDLDADGVRDVLVERVVSSPNRLLRAFLSGATGAAIQSATVPLLSTVDVPATLAGADFNLDGTDEVFYLEPHDDGAGTNAGRLRVQSLIALPTALSTDLGGACGGAGVPAFFVSPPVIGGSAIWSVSGATPYAAGSVVVSFGPPVALPLGAGCVLHLDLTTAPSWLFVPVVADEYGEFGLSVGVPSIPLFAGATLTLQTVFFGTAGPLGLDLTNGVEAQLGF
jgi:hypothetical protein